MIYRQFNLKNEVNCHLEMLNHVLLRQIMFVYRITLTFALSQWILNSQKKTTENIPTLTRFIHFDFVLLFKHKNEHAIA